MENQDLKNNQENTASEETQPLFNVNFVLGQIDDIKTKEEFQKEIDKKDYDKALEIFFKDCYDEFVQVYEKKIGFKHIDNPNIRTFNTSTEKDIILNDVINDLIESYKIHIANPMNINFDSFLYLSIFREESFSISNNIEEINLYNVFCKQLLYQLNLKYTRYINILKYLQDEGFKKLFIEMTGEIQVKLMLSMVLIILLSNKIGEAFISLLDSYVNYNQIKKIAGLSSTAFDEIQNANTLSLKLLEEIKKNNKEIEETKNAIFINEFTKDYKNERDTNRCGLWIFRGLIAIVFASLILFSIVDFKNFSQDVILKHLLVSIPLIGLLIYLLRIEKNYLLEYKNNKEKYYKLNALIPFIQKIYNKEDNLSEEAQKDVFEIGKTFFNNSEVQDKSKDISLQDIEKISNILKVKEK